MRVLITGGTGFVGSAVVAELLRARHEVVGLARSDTAVQALTAAGATALAGDVRDVASLTRAAVDCDGVIHCGFIHDFSKFQENCEIDRRAILALGNVLSGSQRALIVTSGTALLHSGSIAVETSAVPTDAPNPRAASEQAADALSGLGIRACVVRLPPTVHGRGDHGFIPMIIQRARERGVAAYVDDGNNRWPAVHRLDAAQLYRLALEQAVAGMRYHAVAEPGIAFREITTLIGRHLRVPVSSVSGQAAANHFDWMLPFAALDAPASSELTRERLGWQPTHPGLLSDLEREGYFEP